MKITRSFTKAYLNCNRRTMGPIAFISRSSSRVSVLSSLSGTPKDFRDVVADVDSPRTTIRDNLKQLVEQDFIREDTERRYHLTTTGRLFFEVYRKCEREAAVIERLEPFLAHVSNDALPESIALFQDVTLVSRSRSDPYRVISALIDTLRDTQPSRALMPSVTSPVREPIFESSSATPQPVQILTEETDDDSLRDRTDSSPHVTVKQTGQSLPFGLIIDEDQVTVYSLDSEMVAQALIYTDDVSVRRWASYTFQRYWDGGEVHPPYTDRMSY